MGALSKHLLDVVPSHISAGTKASLDAWTLIARGLKAGEGLEEAIGEQEIESTLFEIITTEVANCVGTAELSAISELIEKLEFPTYGRLFEYILQNNNVAEVITTNYDRLLEVAATVHGIRIDTMFYGHTLGRLDERLSREELLMPTTGVGKRADVRLLPRPHVRLSKPHGSLDWFEVGAEIIRSELPVAGTRKIIAPGGSKYRMGYDRPYDQQRQRAISAIDNASAFLTIGYGFNDAHLQTHLKSKFAVTPGVVLAQMLTESAREYLSSNPGSIGIEASPDGLGSLVTRGANCIRLGSDVWKIEILLKEVLGI